VFFTELTFQLFLPHLATWHRFWAIKIPAAYSGGSIFLIFPELNVSRSFALSTGKHTENISVLFDDLDSINAHKH
jgi:hypothetical protein